MTSPTGDDGDTMTAFSSARLSAKGKKNGWWEGKNSAKVVRVCGYGESRESMIRPWSRLEVDKNYRQMAARRRNCVVSSAEKQPPKALRSKDLKHQF